MLVLLILNLLVLPFSIHNDFFISKRIYYGSNYMSIMKLSTRGPRVYDPIIEGLSYLLLLG